MQQFSYLFVLHSCLTVHWMFIFIVEIKGLRSFKSKLNSFTEELCLNFGVFLLNFDTALRILLKCFSSEVVLL